MGKRTYGQYCGLSHALDIVGERWGLLIVRDLLVGPRRFSDLHRGLPRIPTNILTVRLRELEAAGVVRRRLSGRSSGAVAYELTDYGRGLEAVILPLARWGSQTLGDPGPDDILTTDSMTMAMRSTFRPDAARGVHATFELRTGDIVISVRVDNRVLRVQEGPALGADLVLRAGRSLRALMAGQLSPAEAIANGTVSTPCDHSLINRFVDIFRIFPVSPVSPA